MPKNIHTATGPNGETFKRTSATRLYTHTVVGRPIYEAAVRQANARVERSKQEFADRQRDAEHGWEPSSWMRGRPAHKGDYADLAEQHREEGRKYGLDFLDKARADGATTAAQYAALVLRDDLGGIEARKEEGYYDRFSRNFGWAGRPDLADKLAASSQSAAYEVVVLEATVVTK